MCFQIDGKSAQAAKCVKYRIMTKFIDCVLYINTFEKKCVVLKRMLQSPRIKYYTKTNVIDQSLSNSTLFEHRFHKNINKLYKNAGKCDDQQKFKDNLEEGMVYTSKKIHR